MCPFDPCCSRVQRQVKQGNTQLYASLCGTLRGKENQLIYQMSNCSFSQFHTILLRVFRVTCDAAARRQLALPSGHFQVTLTVKITDKEPSKAAPPARYSARAGCRGRKQHFNFYGQRCRANKQMEESQALHSHTIFHKQRLRNREAVNVGTARGRPPNARRPRGAVAFSCPGLPFKPGKNLASFCLRWQVPSFIQPFESLA